MSIAAVPFAASSSQALTFQNLNFLLFRLIFFPSLKKKLSEEELAERTVGPFPVIEDALRKVLILVCSSNHELLIIFMIFFFIIYLFIFERKLCIESTSACEGCSIAKLSSLLNIYR